MTYLADRLREVVAQSPDSHIGERAGLLISAADQIDELIERSKDHTERARQLDYALTVVIPDLEKRLADLNKADRSE